ncbi:hypothetical protein [Streptomyces sp. NPDC048603]|uniref:hypothetical protein n=1 Tax=Streptomyces sp. NPDC048603 TaxID=3365577 RepID=UPI003722029B
MNLKPARLLAAARLAVPAAAALTMTVALAAPASASPAFVTRSGGEVRFAALPGEVNTVTFNIVSGNVVVTDTTSTLTPGPGCVPLTPNSVRCGTSTGLSRIAATLGDQNDSATNNTSAPSDLVGGDGDDRLIGGSGPDRLTDQDGWNASPGATTTFEGRGGSDVIISRNGGFDRIDCGETAFDFDVLVADPATLDTGVPNSCEFVTR